MSVAHNHIASRLVAQLVRQLDETRFTVRSNAGHIQRSSESYFVPDLFVIPVAIMAGMLRQNPYQLESYVQPVPLVVEIWSPSTGDYDVQTKLGEYQRRGDLEIWLVHPYDCTLIAWVRQPDGRYVEALHRGGLLHPTALPAVAIDLNTLFA